MRRAHGIGALAALLAALALVPAAGAAGALRLRLEGWPGSSVLAEDELQPALRAGADSSAVPRALAALTARLQAEGWLDAHVRAQRTQDVGGAVLAVTVEPGTRFHWGRLTIEAEPADSLAYARGLRWQPGVPADPGALGVAIERVVDDAEAQGYAWATLGVTGWHEDSARVDVRLTGTRGPRVRIANVRVDGLDVTRPDVVEKAMGRLRGNPYNPAAARAATQRLTQLGIFRRVDYLGISAPGDWREGTLRWRVAEPRYNTFEGAVGVQGSAGVVGLARLELGNLLGTARSTSLSWQSQGAGHTDFGARYVDPLLFGRALRWEAALQQQIQDTTYSRFTWGTRLGVALGERERVEAGFDDERVVQTHGDVEDADVQNTTFALERDGRDDARSPRAGTWLRLEATQSFTHDHTRPSATDAGSSRDVTGDAVQLQSEWNRALGRSSGLSLEADAAGRFSSDRVLATWEHYLLGGAATLRGHAEQEFSVDRYVLTRLEWRWFLGAPGQRLALFWDHAQMQTRVALPAGGDELQNQGADGVGVGLRLPAAGGDVDLDYGIAPGHGFLDGKIHLRLVTAF